MKWDWEKWVSELDIGYWIPRVCILLLLAILLGYAVYAYFLGFSFD